jgi:hypothetical protein
MIEIMPNQVVFGTPPKMVENIKLTLADWKNKGMIPTKELRSFVGRLSWVAGTIPRLRWAVTTIYAVLTAATKEEATEVEFGTKESGRQEAKDWPGGSQETWHGIPLALCDVPDTGPADQKRAFRRRKQCGVWLQTPHPQVGGTWHPVEAFQSLLQEHKAAAQEIEYGEASSQAVMEGLAIFRALQLWSTKTQGGPVVIR